MKKYSEAELKALIEDERKTNNMYVDEGTTILLDWLEDHEATLEDIYKLYCTPKQTRQGLSERVVYEWLARHSEVIDGRNLAFVKRYIPYVATCGGDLATIRFPFDIRPYIDAWIPAYYVIPYVKFRFLQCVFWKERFTKDIEYVLSYSLLNKYAKEYKENKNNKYQDQTKFIKRVFKHFHKCSEVSITLEDRGIVFKQRQRPWQQVYFSHRYVKADQWFSDECNTAIEYFKTLLHKNGV